jgi:hypothetical protein
MCGTSTTTREGEYVVSTAEKRSRRAGRRREGGGGRGAGWLAIEVSIDFGTNNKVTMVNNIEDVPGA